MFIQKKENAVLTATSVLSILLLSLHVTDDIARGFDQWQRPSVIFCVILGVLLYGTLLLSERRSGRILMLIVGLGSLGMPIIHSRAGTVARTSGGFFFLWTLVALGATGSLIIILALGGLLIKRADGTMAAAANESPDR